jgi:hypothetical protein
VILLDHKTAENARRMVARAKDLPWLFKKKKWSKALEESRHWVLINFADEVFPA